MHDNKDRFQWQPWYIKLWRCRWYLLVPYYTFKSWWPVRNKVIIHNGKEYQPEGFKNLWNVNIGLTDCRTERYWTAEEMKNGFVNKHRKKKWSRIKGEDDGGL